MAGRANDNPDPSLACLVLLLRFKGVAAGPARIGHRLGIAK
jgi:hypothetical protein